MCSTWDEWFVAPEAATRSQGSAPGSSSGHSFDLWVYVRSPLGGVMPRVGLADPSTSAERPADNGAVCPRAARSDLDDGWYGKDEDEDVEDYDEDEEEEEKFDDVDDDAYEEDEEEEEEEEEDEEGDDFDEEEDEGK